ncbi:MAG TPA: exosortase-associated EpsI family protein [Gemmataceae bacterium]|jgi:hypothetical protein|nr:exosortase-associated EpsI family protein [Gemmataceae bacterium]
MFRSLYVLVGLLLLLGTGLVHGIWTNRWLSTDEPQASAARLDSLPIDFGEWHGTELSINPTALAIGEIVNYKQRQYVNHRTGAELTVLVVCGKPGPISVHTPEVCFPGAGYKMLGEPGTVALVLEEGRPSGEFKTARFQRLNSTETSEMEAFWAWTTDGRWQAPNYPRWTYGRYPALYKVYIIRKISAKSGPPEEELKQARDFMIELDKVIRSEGL